jgi:hypothetical protein
MVKDDIGLQTSGAYCILYECSEVYIGQTSRTIEIICQEDIKHLHHGQTGKSGVAEHLLNTGHKTQFEKTHRLNRTTTYMNQIVKEAIEIHL